MCKNFRHTAFADKPFEGFSVGGDTILCAPRNFVYTGLYFYLAPCVLDKKSKTLTIIFRVPWEAKNDSSGLRDIKSSHLIPKSSENINVMLFFALVLIFMMIFIKFYVLIIL